MDQKIVEEDVTVEMKRKLEKHVSLLVSDVEMV
jgi:hypothetical protein